MQNQNWSDFDFQPTEPQEKSSLSGLVTWYQWQLVGNPTCLNIIFVWDAWFHGQIVYSNIEHLSNIDEIYLEYEIENYNRAISICGCLVVMQLF